MEQEVKVYSNVRKGGRCWNGFHRDGGVIIHIKEGTEPSGFWGGKALCGTEVGYRGYGWAKESLDRHANCPKCVKKLEKLKNSKADKN